MKKFISSKAAPSDVLNYNEGSTDASFKDGKSVFSRNWPYQYGLIKAGDVAVKTDQVGIAPLPKGGCVGGWLLGMNSKSKIRMARGSLLSTLQDRTANRLCLPRALIFRGTMHC